MSAVTASLSHAGGMSKLIARKDKLDKSNQNAAKASIAAKNALEQEAPALTPHGDELHTGSKGSEPIGGNEAELASEAAGAVASVAKYKSVPFKMKGFSGFGNK